MHLDGSGRKWEVPCTSVGVGCTQLIHFFSAWIPRGEVGAVGARMEGERAGPLLEESTGLHVQVWPLAAT